MANLNKQLTVICALGMMAWMAPGVFAQDLPEGPGKAEVESNCSTCHNLNRVVNHRDSLEGWQGIVDMMVGFGGMFTDSDKTVMAQYLFSNFPDKAPEKAPEAKPAEATPAPAEQPQSQSDRSGVAPVADAMDVKLPEGVARQWVEESCVQCHALSRIARAGHTRAEWASIVEAMIRLGAPLTPNKVDSTIDYLAAAFPNKSPQPKVDK